MSNLLGKAVEHLSIIDVKVRRVYVNIDDEIDASSIVIENYKVQGTRGVKKIIELVSDQSGSKLYRYSFQYEVGVRLVSFDQESDQNNSTENPVVIMATFDALYNSKDKLEDEVLQEFSKENVGYHVWPYWRELVQSSCSRVGIQVIPTPFYFCKTASPEQGKEVKVAGE